MMESHRQSSLKNIAHECAEKVRNARSGVSYFEAPYRHLVVDDFLPVEMAKLCLSSFPALDHKTWEYTNDPDIEVKYRSTWESEFDIPDGIVNTIRILNSSLFLRAMADRFKIDKIVPDPYFTGGGLNVTCSGGLLDIHVDGNYHDATGLNRRLNALIYLNPGWQVGWGGEFGVYDDKGERCIKQIEPLFNRLVIFDSHDKSYHGLPTPINFPAGNVRSSILLYYYTKESRPDAHIEVQEPHSALWKNRNFQDKRGNKTRDFY